MWCSRGGSSRPNLARALRELSSSARRTGRTLRVLKWIALDSKRLTDEQIRALRIASRYDMRNGNKLGTSLDSVRELADLGYLERVGTVNNVPCYRLSKVG